MDLLPQKMIRAMKAPKNKVPIIAITAHALLVIEKNALEAGMDEYISKPVIAKESCSYNRSFLKN